MNDHEKFYEEVFRVDPKIRYVGFFHNGKLEGRIRSGLKKLIPLERSEDSLRDSITRWRSRQKLSPMIGKPIYAMAMYEQVKRFTIAFDNILLFISAEIEVDNENLVLKLHDVLVKFNKIL